MTQRRIKALLIGLSCAAIPLVTAASCNPYSAEFYRDDDEDDCYGDCYYDEGFYYDDCYYGDCYYDEVIYYE